MSTKKAPPSKTHEEKNPLDTKEVSAAVGALLKHHHSAQEKAGRGSLVEDTTPVSVQISLRNVPPSRVRPIAM